jgi:YggT family protein
MASIIFTLFQILNLLILARVLMSWFRPDPGNPIVRALYEITDPILVPFQRLIPPMGGIDFSPIVALLVLSLLQRLLLGFLA